MKDDHDMKRIVADLIKLNPTKIKKNILVSQVVSEIHIPECEDESIITISIYDHVKRIVGEVIRDLKKIPPESAQIEFEGFEHVQERYSIFEKGEWVLIPTSEMTIAQLYQKVNDLRKDRDGLDEHIEELLDYIRTRKIINFDDGDVA